MIATFLFLQCTIHPANCAHAEPRTFRLLLLLRLIILRIGAPLLPCKRSGKQSGKRTWRVIGKRRLRLPIAFALGSPCLEVELVNDAFVYLGNCEFRLPIGKRSGYLPKEAFAEKHTSPREDNVRKNMS